MMTHDFYQGLITGVATQPLQVSTEHATPDSDLSDIHVIKFETTNLLTSGDVTPISGSWGDFTVKDDLLFVNMNSNMRINWYGITNAFSLDTNCMYKWTCNHANFYGRFGISTHGAGNAIYEYEFKNCACASMSDNRMLIYGHDTCVFMVIPSGLNETQTVIPMWCSDYTHDGSKEAFSVGLGLYKQIL